MEEKIIKTDLELKALLAANKFHTFDYAQEMLNISEDIIETIEISIEDTHCYIYLYPTYDKFWEDIKSNFLNWEPTEGNDDQYYDYNPSCLEAILYAIPLLNAEHQDYIITGLKTKLKSFTEDEDQDEGMIQQYQSAYDALEKYESDHRETALFNELYVSNLLNQLNK